MGVEKIAANILGGLMKSGKVISKNGIIPEAKMLSNGKLFVRSIEKNGASTVTNMQLFDRAGEEIVRKTRTVNRYSDLVPSNGKGYHFGGNGNSKTSDLRRISRVPSEGDHGKEFDRFYSDGTKETVGRFNTHYNEKYLCLDYSRNGCYSQITKTGEGRLGADIVFDNGVYRSLKQMPDYKNGKLCNWFSDYRLNAKTGRLEEVRSDVTWWNPQESAKRIAKQDGEIAKFDWLVG